jgi:biopolymer transport protein ExbD
MKLSKSIDAKLGVQVSPLIDVVFLLLIYFMVTSSLIKKDAALSFALPIIGSPLSDMPVEVVVVIAADGTVDLNGIHFHQDDQSLDGLAAQITDLKTLAAAQRSEFHVNILPHDQTLHRRIIDVMDACAKAGIANLGFSAAL